MLSLVCVVIVVCACVCFLILADQTSARAAAREAGEIACPPSLCLHGHTFPFLLTFLLISALKVV